MNSKHVSGIAVVSISGGEKLGTIGELYLDPGLRRVIGYEVIGGGGLLSTEPKASRWLDAKRLHAIGPDALTVSDSGAVDGPTPPGSVSLADVTRRKVITEGGTLVGPVVSVQLDERGTSVVSLEVGTGLLRSNRMVSTTQVVNVGEELIIVRDAVLADEGATGGASEEPAQHRFLSGDIEPLASTSSEVTRVEAARVDAPTTAAPSSDADSPAAVRSNASSQGS